ncbi:12324_t:CDS:2, partial [Acaulospora colombiana]
MQLNVRYLQLLHNGIRRHGSGTLDMMYWILNHGVANVDVQVVKIAEAGISAYSKMPSSLNASMTDSITRAIDRTPIEIWTLILLSAIHQSLLPSSDKSLLPNIHIFNNHLEHLGQDTEETSVNFRILERSLLLLEAEDSTKHLARVNYSAVKALTLTDYPENHTHISLFTDLRLLSTLYLDPDSIQSTFPTLLLTLTHLQVPRIYVEQDRDAEVNLAFPRLQTLNINLSAQVLYRGKRPMTARHVDMRGYILDFSNWSLPSLVNIGFYGADGREADVKELLERL